MHRRGCGSVTVLDPAWGCYLFMYSSVSALSVRFLGGTVPMYQSLCFYAVSAQCT